MILRDLRVAALVPLGAVVACTSILGNDFTIVEGSGGAGGSGTGVGAQGGSGGTSDGGAPVGGGGTGGQGGEPLPPLACAWSLPMHFPVAQSDTSSNWTGNMHAFRIDSDRVRIVVERFLASAGNMIEVRTLDPTSQTSLVSSFPADDLHDVRRVSFGGLGVLFSEFEGNFPALKLRTIADSGDGSQGGTDNVTPVAPAVFPDLDPDNGIAAAMAQVNTTGVVDILIRYREQTSGNYSIAYGRFNGQSFTPTVIASDLESGEAEIGALTHHDGFTYAYLGQAFSGGQVTQYQLEPGQGVVSTRAMEPEGTFIFAYGVAPMNDFYSVVTFATSVEVRVGPVPVADLLTFEFSDLGFVGSWATSVDLPVNYGDYAWLDQTFAMIGAPEGDQSQMRAFIMGPDGSTLTDADLPFTATVGANVTRDIDEVGIAKRAQAFPPEGGDIHVAWIEDQTNPDSTQVTQMYYDVLRCLAE